jgi:hypothetical protein
MNFHHQLIILFIGGFFGWSLFVYTLLSALCSRKKEIHMIEEIATELEKVKKELKALK